MSGQQKKSHRRSRKGRQFDRKLLSYTMAAGAGLGLAQSADGRIVYSGIKNIPITENSTVGVDVDGNIPDFTFRHTKEIIR